MKTGPPVDSRISVSASKDDDEAHWLKRKGKPAIDDFKAHVGADADAALVEEILITPANVNDGKAGPKLFPIIRAKSSPAMPIGLGFSRRGTHESRRAMHAALTRPPYGQR